MIRDAAIAGLCLGTANFIVVLGRTKLFPSGLDIAVLWVTIVGFAALSLAVFLLVLRPIIPLRKTVWVALLLGVSFPILEPSLRSPALFSDAVKVPEEPMPTVEPAWYDRTVNQVQRQAGRIDRPTHIFARSWSAQGWDEMGSHPSRNLRLEGTSRSRQVGQLTSMLEGGEDVLDPDMVERLRALGYTE